MRISRLGSKDEWTPYLNGEPLGDCVEFDTDRCWAMVYCRDEDGKLIKDGDSLKTTTVSGLVTATKKSDGKKKKK